MRKIMPLCLCLFFIAGCSEPKQIISAYNYYENAPYADNFGIPERLIVDIEEVETNDEIETQEQVIETEVVSEEEKTVKETDIETTNYVEPTTKTADNAKTITFSPIKNPRRTLADISPNIKIIVNTIMKAIRKGTHITLKEDLYDVEEAIRAIEEIYYPYTHGGTGLYATDTKEGVFVTFHSHAQELFEKNKYIENRIRSTAHMIMARGMKEEVAVKRINDWIINAVDYDRDTRDLYSLFFNHKGNCESYSNVFEQFCDYVGIECMSIVGEAGEGHEWNKVKVNGKWYYIDVTFNQNTDNKYYLSEKLWDSHKILLEYKSTFPDS